MDKGRLEAFSDGVIAIIVTIMVLELKVPSAEHGALEALRAIGPMLFVYLLSFIQVGIYWVNHHYMVDEVEQVTHGLLWANLMFLFTLSLFPLAAAWVHEWHITPFSMQVYAVCSVLPAITWGFVARAIRSTGAPLTGAGSLPKRIASTVLYISAIVVAHWLPYVALALISVVAILWLIPPRHVVEIARKKRLQHPR